MHQPSQWIEWERDSNFNKSFYSITYLTISLCEWDDRMIEAVIEMYLMVLLLMHSHKMNLHKKSSFETFLCIFWRRGAYIVEGFHAHLLACSNVTQRHFHNWLSLHNHMNMSHITVMMIWWRRKINCSHYFVKLIDMLSNRSHYVRKIISNFFRFFYCAYACHFFCYWHQ